MALSDEDCSELVNTLNLLEQISSLAPFGIALVALGSAMIALRIYKQSKKVAEAELVLKANEKYTQLKQNLRYVGDWSEKQENIITLKSIESLSTETDWKAALDTLIVPNEVWENNHEIKNYFKGYYRLWKAKLISAEVLHLCMNQYGYNLLLDTVKLLDMHRYFYVRRNRFDVDGDREFLKLEFKNEFRWYSDLEKKLSRYEG